MIYNLVTIPFNDAELSNSFVQGIIHPIIFVVYAESLPSQVLANIGLG